MPLESTLCSFFKPVATTLCVSQSAGVQSSNFDFRLSEVPHLTGLERCDSSPTAMHSSDRVLLELPPPRVFVSVAQSRLGLLVLVASSAILVAHKKEVKQGSDDEKKWN